MEDYKIRVKNESESKEAQELFFELGYKFSMVDFCADHNSVQVFDDGSGSLFEDHDTCSNEELTLPQLRDLVVLKRNDVGDATHVAIDGSKYLKCVNYFCFWNGMQWRESSIDFNENNLKPIEKSMKEYLDPRNGYKLIEAPESESLEPHASEWIEVPEGSTAARLCNEGVEFYKNDFGMFFSLISRNWINSISPRSVLMENIVWQRHTQPEGLPPTDDEPEITIAKGSELDCIAKIYDMRDRYDGESDEDYRHQLENYISRKDPSLNDRYAEIEKVQKSAWGVQVGGDHYKSMKIQPAKFALENKLDYCQANAIKYICRHESKNGKQDLEKAKHYIDLLIEHYYGNS